jgi:hypothetical protein
MLIPIDVHIGMLEGRMMETIEEVQLEMYIGTGGQISRGEASLCASDADPNPLLLRQVVNGPEPINRRFRICFMASTLYA